MIRRRGTLSEAISTIQGRQIEDVPNASLSQMLEGQILGLGTLEDSSDPGNASVYKYVRGISSNQGTQPLFVVDGIVMQDYNYEFLTAAEIENIVVLKDAAATAIYGLKGANGVVVINTKSGLPGAFDVRVTGRFLPAADRPQARDDLLLRICDAAQPGVGERRVGGDGSFL